MLSNGHYAFVLGEYIWLASDATGMDIRVLDS